MYGHWLAAFHAVARCGGFTAAAQVLHIGQPTVSMHVRALEDHFGVELFHRRGRVIELSQTGKQLLAITHGLFGHEEEAIQLLRAAHALELGSLRVGSLWASDVMEIGSALLAQHPNLQLHVRIQTSPETLDALIKFDLDLGLIGYAPSDSTFFSLLYNKYRIVVVARSDHPLAKRRAIRIEELECQKIVMRAPGSTTRAAFQRALDKAGVKIRTAMETNTGDSVRAAVLRGIGLGAMSESEVLDHPELKALPVTNADIFGQSYVVCLKDRRDRPLIARFLQHAKKGARNIRNKE